VLKITVKHIVKLKPPVKVHFPIGI